MLREAQAECLRRLSLGDAAPLDALLHGHDGIPPALGEPSASLVRLAALIVLDPALPAFQQAIRRALDAGADTDEVMAVLMAIAPIVGSAIVMSAAPKVAMALGYDVDAAFEGVDP